MTTKNPPNPGWINSLVAALGIGVLLALAALLDDFLCLPAFEEISGSGKGTALVRGLIFAFSQPALFYPAFAGFSVLALICLRFALLFRPGSRGRTLGALAPVLLLLLGVMWLILLASDASCAVHSGLQRLAVVAGVTLLALAGLFLLFRRDREAR